LALGLVAAPAYAADQSNVSAAAETLIPQEDLPVLAKLIGISLMTDASKRLAALDDLLASQPGPTPMRGLIQVGRCSVLDWMDRLVEARAAGDEAIRLLPDWAPAKLAGLDSFIFVPDPSEAADHWLIASHEDPLLANQVSAYSMNALVDRLDEVGDRHRADLVRARLVETDYSKGVPRDRSARALAVFKTKIEAGDLAGAIAAIPSITSPFDAAAVLADKRYAAAWPNMQTWAGPRLEQQWSTFITLNQQAWDASHDIDAGAGYAAALAGNGNYAEELAELPDNLSPDAITPDVLGSSSLAAKLASAMVQLGQGAKAVEYLSRAWTNWAGKDNVNGLNLLANLGADQHEIGDDVSAFKTFAQVDEIVARNRDALNQGAVAGIAQAEACTAEAAGDHAQAMTRLGTIGEGNPDALLSALSCLNRYEDARALMLRLLADPDKRSFALRKMQRQRQDNATASNRRMAAFNERLAHDPQLLKALEPYGRVLDYPISGIPLKTTIPAD
jgi:hypothetical protein